LRQKQSFQTVTDALQDLLQRYAEFDPVTNMSKDATRAWYRLIGDFLKIRSRGLSKEAQREMQAPETVREVSRLLLYFAGYDAKVIDDDKLSEEPLSKLAERLAVLCTAWEERVTSKASVRFWVGHTFAQHPLSGMTMKDVDDLCAERQEDAERQAGANGSVWVFEDEDVEQDPSPAGVPGLQPNPQPTHPTLVPLAALVGLGGWENSHIDYANGTGWVSPPGTDPARKIRLPGHADRVRELSPRRITTNPDGDNPAGAAPASPAGPARGPYNEGEGPTLSRVSGDFIDVAGDGNCFFRVLARTLDPVGDPAGDQQHANLRRDLVRHMRTPAFYDGRQDEIGMDRGEYDRLLSIMATPEVYHGFESIGELQIQAAAELWHFNIQTFQSEYDAGGEYRLRINPTSGFVSRTRT
jgi:hypothetical protein